MIKPAVWVTRPYIFNLCLWWTKVAWHTFGHTDWFLAVTAKIAYPGLETCPLSQEVAPKTFGVRIDTMSMLSDVCCWTFSLLVGDRPVMAILWHDWKRGQPHSKACRRWPRTNPVMSL